MIKKYSLAKLITLLFVLLMAGCSSHDVKPAVPITVFNPTSGTFNARIVLFQLNGSGRVQNLESGIVPIAQNVITTLEGIGYHYTPDGPVNYLIEARIGSLSPKLVAQGASERVGFGIGSYGGLSYFRSYPVIVTQWTPEMQRIKSGPDSCFITMQILIKELKDQREEVVYYGTPTPIEVPYKLGCPFSECGQGASQALSNYLLKTFTPAVRQ